MGLSADCPSRWLKCSQVRARSLWFVNLPGDPNVESVRTTGPRDQNNEGSWLSPKLLVSGFKIAQQALPECTSCEGTGWARYKDATSLQGAYNLAGKTKQKGINLKNALPTHTLEAQKFDGPLFLLLWVSAIVLTTPGISFIISSHLEPDCLLISLTKQREQNWVLNI